MFRRLCIFDCPMERQALVSTGQMLLTHVDYIKPPSRAVGYVGA